MHLGILTQYYPPEMGAPQARLSELAAHTVRRGHVVTVLTAMPNYPTGRIHDGYGRWFMRERRDEVDVIRTAIYPTQKADLARRLTNYFSFVASSAACGSVVLDRLDYLLVESPPLFLGISGVWLSRLKGARLIFNVSDLWPESAVRLGVLRAGSMSWRLSARLEGWCYRRAWLVTGQSRSTVADIAARYPACLTFHLSNGVDTTRVRPDCASDRARSELTAGRAGQCIVFYAGLHGLAQGLDQATRAAQLLEGEAVRLVLMGDGPEKPRLVAEARARQASNVDFLDPRPAADVPAYLASADIVLICLKTRIPGAVPSKLYEAMASARPVLLVDEGEAAEIVTEHRAGIVVRPGDIDGIASAIRTLAANPRLRWELGANGRRAAEQRFDRARIAAAFIDHLESCLEPWAPLLRWAGRRM